MFLDRYMLIHNMEGAGSVGSEYKPRIGIYDKSVDYESSSPSFLQ